MGIETSKTNESVSSAVVRKADFVHNASAGGVFTIVCRDKDGKLKWEDSMGSVLQAKYTRRVAFNEYNNFSIL